MLSKGDVEVKINEYLNYSHVRRPGGALLSERWVSCSPHCGGGTHSYTQLV